MSVYYYGYLYRPPMPGAQPREGLNVTYEKRFTASGIGMWGYAVYERELTPEECWRYELARIKPEDIQKGDEK